MLVLEWHHTKYLYGRKCRTPICWGEVGQKEVGGTKVVLETNQKIEMNRDRLKASQDRQKSYVDKCRRSIEFPEAYRLELLEELAGIHNTFHVFYLRKYLPDDSMWVPLNKITLNNKLEYVEEPIVILDEKVKEIRNKRIRTYKVQWRHRKGSECIWESEDLVLEHLPSLHAVWIVGTRSGPSGGDCDSKLVDCEAQALIVTHQVD
ncbi:uncharacterized protein [Rutidosis leptorrhynchoides]|uniref:uncharacterized protein n=1 Tax=Rutidosis leptorrhynchoides TaxID=125765 RepID=UPI003A9A4D7F